MKGYAIWFGWFLAWLTVFWLFAGVVSVAAGVEMYEAGFLSLLGLYGGDYVDRKMTQ